MPILKKLSDEVAKMRGIAHRRWNLGVHPVLYRDHRDSMGDHADDDQGETCIFCVLVNCNIPRKVRINVSKKLTKNGGHQEGDEVIELFLRTGDAYEMDRNMQLSYSHSVPKAPKKIVDDYSGTMKNRSKVSLLKQQRICVVLRRGRTDIFDRDSGRPCKDLSPKIVVGNIRGEVKGQCKRRTTCLDLLMAFSFMSSVKILPTVKGLEVGCLRTRNELRSVGGFTVRTQLSSSSIEPVLNFVLINEWIAFVWS